MPHPQHQSVRRGLGLTFPLTFFSRFSLSLSPIPSSYYFDAGPFRLPTAGCTHLGTGGRGQQIAMYRLHDQDPLLFGTEGFRLRYRIGDTTDPATGLKCTLETGGTPTGSPMTTDLLAYAWVYVW